MNLGSFQPLVAEWFTGRLGSPTAPQEAGWTHIASGRDTLIAAPTGSGKTLAAFLWWINELVGAGLRGELDDETMVVYVSPLKALGNDIQKNLQEPLREIRELAQQRGVEIPEIRVAVRSGDTPQTERQAMLKRPPHILITTPESFFILLTADGSRNFVKTARAVIVDEIHAVAGDKRGSHLALSLERLDLLCGRRCQRIGLSATQKPIDEIGRLLVGTEHVLADGSPDCSIVDAGHRRDWELWIEVPGQPLSAFPTHELRAEILDRVVALSAQHRTTLVFVNTRRLVERLAHELSERLGQGKVAAHHGSLSRETRLEAERGLKSGEIPVVVATASLELGIDIGHVDLVVHYGAPRALATMLQRIGRAGHGVGSVSKGVLFPLTRDELVQCAAAVRAARGGELDRVLIPTKPLDILSQQVVAIAAAGEIAEEELWTTVRRAWPFRDLERKEFDDILEMLAEGVNTRQGRRSARLHRDRVNGVVTGRRGARLAAITSGGAIPDVGDYRVLEEPTGAFVGTVNEDFAIESMAGDIFLLGNMSWRIRRVESGSGVVRVEDAHGAPPTIPFWVGEAPARTRELSQAVSELREEVARRLDRPDECVEWLIEQCGIDRDGAEQIVVYIRDTIAVLGCVPTTRRVVAERFFDEAGGMQLIVHAPFGGRINRAWGLALRKRFCVSFDFELQAAATDDGIVLSLGEQHSFPLETTFAFVRTNTLDESLEQSALVSPLFGTRWRWNAQRALALLRFQGGRKVPFPILRMRSDDLLGSVFPELVGCQEERSGPIPVPDHPLITETMRNCLNEAMDIESLREIVGRIERDELECVSVETPEPSQMSHEILNANPYAFLDNAPLEERRARAVALRRADPDLARGIGALDVAAIDEVRSQAQPDIRDAHELHDHLLTVCVLPVGDAAEWSELTTELASSGRATLARWTAQDGSLRVAWVPTEQTRLVQRAMPGVVLDEESGLAFASEPESRDDAVRTIVHGWMQSLGPVSASELAVRLGLTTSDVDIAMAALEATGIVLRGHFTPGLDGLEWCERGLLARIHRLTIRTLREQIEPVTAAGFMRFLFGWQHLAPGTRLHARDGIVQIVRKLQGFELPAPAWEAHVLPSRVIRYDGSDLEHLCLSGVLAWGRLAPEADPDEGVPGPADPARRRAGTTRNTPISFLLREDLHLLAGYRRADGEAGLSTAGEDVVAYLRDRGASFLNEIARGTGRMHSEVEDALWELVSAGLVTGDGVAGLRRLLAKGDAKPRRPVARLRALPGSGAAAHRPLPVGRWALWRTDGEPPDERERLESLAVQLLLRYGVVFRDLLARERRMPTWRALLDVYRRMEARQEIRGGRFVAGFIGEQFALPEAVEALRSIRRGKPDQEILFVSAADPTNLVGIVLPGTRVSPTSGQTIAYRDGVALDVGAIGTLRSRLRASGEIPVTSRA